MKITFTDEENLAIQSAIVSLRGLRPVLNAVPLDALGVPVPAYVFAWTKQTFEVSKISKVSVTLAAPERLP